MRFRPMFVTLTSLWMIFSGGAGAEAMGNSPRQLTATCGTEGAKTALPDGLCALFLQRLAVAYPDARVTEGSELRLVVQKLSGVSITARIDTVQADGVTQQGAHRAMMRRGAAPDQAALSQFLDALIGATPLP
ncbi:hypothetical protein [Puniceibacterium sp. IMCC21224]|uniref:hypothetical protein n=1 Tax=Puniceibacterium sp. IMCC21224 TaxID=1618204 RepID=UPI00064DA328|nr:hypothetical protein [Puniceibacterium sp. IMCC21224]KMK63975.1 hypothetical protein IMCC21224_1633 [Puniceibacterium sp. IMCC21224]